MMWLNTALIGRAKDYVMDSMLVGWRNDAEKLAISVRNIPIHRFYKRIYISNRQNWHISYSMLYAQNCLFYSTLGKCIDLLPGTCLHMKNVLSCKNRCVSELCKDTCNDCTKGIYYYCVGISENLYMYTHKKGQKRNM